jgi:hypothetical protein
VLVQGRKPKQKRKLVGGNAPLDAEHDHEQDEGEPMLPPFSS